MRKYLYIRIFKIYTSIFLLRLNFLVSFGNFDFFVGVFYVFLGRDKGSWGVIFFRKEIGVVLGNWILSREWFFF